MSYDIEFRPVDGSLDMAQVRVWLSGQTYWKVDLQTAVYENSDTGVYFILDLNDKPSEAPLVASINVYRPSFFILEIQHKLGELVTAFDLKPTDLQHDDDAESMSGDQLVARWRQANQEAHGIFAPQDTSPACLPERVLTEAWAWNHSRAGLQASVSDDVFVPRIMAIGTKAGPGTAVVWSDAIPFLLPEVSHVIVFRKRLAPRRPFRSKSDTVLVTRESVVKALGPLGVPADDHLEFRGPEVPADLERWVEDLPARKRDFTGIPWDQIHDFELIENS